MIQVQDATPGEVSAEREGGEGATPDPGTVSFTAWINKSNLDILYNSRLDTLCYSTPHRKTSHLLCVAWASFQSWDLELDEGHASPTLPETRDSPAMRRELSRRPCSVASKEQRTRFGLQDNSPVLPITYSIHMPGE
jgi:hypothetical protein